MEQSDKFNNSMETETILKNEESSFQAKNGSTALVVLFVLYAIIFAIIYVMYDRVIPIISAKILDITLVLIVIAVYFRLAKKKLPDGNKVKKYDEQTRKIALTIIILAISINVLLFLLFIFGFGTY